MLPQERLRSALQELPDGPIYAFAVDDDPNALTLRSLAAEQGALFFSYQTSREFAGDTEDLPDPAAVCYIGLGVWRPAAHDAALQRNIRSLTLVVHRNCCEDAIFVFDQTWRGTGWSGKGGRAVPILISNGYKIRHAGGNPEDITILQRGELLSKFRTASQLATA